MRIASVGTAFPPYRVAQTEFTEKLRNYWGSKLPEPRLLTRLHANCGVEFRNFVLPLESYPGLVGFKATNDVWIANAVELGPDLHLPRARIPGPDRGGRFRDLFRFGDRHQPAPPSMPGSST